MGGERAISQKVKKTDPEHTGMGSAGDPCDLKITVDLVGVRSDVLAPLTPGEALSVKARAEGAYTIVVCETAGGDVAGTLAAFRGLAQLIRCISNGVDYRGVIRSVSLSHCTVDVQRA